MRRITLIFKLVKILLEFDLLSHPARGVKGLLFSRRHHSLVQNSIQWILYKIFITFYCPFFLFPSSHTHTHTNIYTHTSARAQSTSLYFFLFLYLSSFVYFSKHYLQPVLSSNITRVLRWYTTQCKCLSFVVINSSNPRLFFSSFGQSHQYIKFSQLVRIIKYQINLLNPF